MEKSIKNPIVLDCEVCGLGARHELEEDTPKGDTQISCFHCGVYTKILADGTFNGTYDSEGN